MTWWKTAAELFIAIVVLIAAVGWANSTFRPGRKPGTMRDSGSSRAGRMPRGWQVLWIVYLLVALGILLYAFNDRGMRPIDFRAKDARTVGPGQIDPDLLGLWLIEYARQEYRRTGELIFGVGWVCIGFVLLAFYRPITEIPVRRSDIPNISYR